MALPPIRTGTTPPVQVPNRPADTTRTAAQRAFFQAAVGVEAPAAATRRPVEATPATDRFTARNQQKAFVPDEPPTRILRPGSFIDIKV